jgi:CheY-like chemotaxis protein
VGSTFYFTVKLKSSTRQPIESESKLTTKKFAKPYHVLIVDDDKINQLVAAQFLASWSLKSTAASSGIEALELVDKYHFDIILMDIQMPDMNGFEVAKIIRSKKVEQLQLVPILAMTAASADDVKDDSENSGINGFVSKPFNADDFFRSLSEALEFDFKENEVHLI